VLGTFSTKFKRAGSMTSIKAGRCLSKDDVKLRAADTVEADLISLLNLKRTCLPS
jgi:hypothetical protein